MQLYSEIYNCYYNIIHDLLRKNGPFSKDELSSVIESKGFDETILYLIPKLDSGEWDFFEKNNDVYISKLKGEPAFVLSLLQKRWLKSILSDNRIKLFLDDNTLSLINTALCDIEPLYKESDFYIYDRFTDGDDYSDDNYRKNFRTILWAIHNRQYLNISFNTQRNKRLHYWYLPCKLEYSVKNDRFRLLALESRGRSQYVLHIINLSRIESITETGEYADKTPNINEYITKEYNDEPVTLLVNNERNTLERAMLQFANYKKNTVRIDNNTYKCDIYYNKSNETELLIEVLSFGPTIKVIGNEHFLKLLKQRLRNQIELINE